MQYVHILLLLYIISEIFLLVKCFGDLLSEHTEIRCNLQNYIRSY